MDTVFALENSVYSVAIRAKKKNLIYEKADLEDDFAVYCQYTDGCTDGIWHSILHGTWTTGAALGARW